MKRFLLFCMAIMLLSLAGCKSAKTPGLSVERTTETRDAIRTTVDDPARVESMLAVMDAFESDVVTIESEIQDIRKEIVEANADYHTERATLEAMYAELGNQALKLGNVLRDRTFELRDLCSADEWKKIAGSDDPLAEFVF